MKTPWEIELIKPEQKWEITLSNKVSYVLPIASPEQLGGVKPDSKTSDMDIPVAVDEEGKLWTKDKIDETLSIKGFSADAAAVGEALKSIKVDGFVSYTEQTLTDEQKDQARKNIGATGLNLHVIYDSGTGSVMYYAPDNSNGNVIDYEQAMQIPSTTMDNRSALYSFCADAYGIVLPNSKIKKNSAKKLAQNLAVLVDAGLVTIGRQYNFYFSPKSYPKERLPNILDDFYYIGVYLLNNNLYQVRNLRRHDRGERDYTLIQADGTISFDFNVLTDKTLSVTDLAADAEVVGKELANKIDKTEVVLRNEVEETDAIELAIKTGLVSPVAAEDGSIYTDENGVLYTL